MDLKGPNSEECQRLGMLFGRAIDAAKSGEALQIPEDLRSPPDPGPADREWVWQTLSKISRERKETLRTDVIVRNPDDISEEFILDFLGEKCSNVTEYEKFRLTWLFCNRDFAYSDALDYFLKTFVFEFNFGMMTREEKCEVVGVGVPVPLVFNALLQSEILLPEDTAYFKSFFKSLGWCFTLSVSRDDFDPCLFTLALMDRGKKLLVLRMPEQVALAFVVNGPLREGDGIDLEKDSVQTFFISRSFGLKRMFRSLPGFKYDLLREDRLQIYEEVQRRSFLKIWLKKKGIVPRGGLSIDLTRFGGLDFGPAFGRPHPRINANQEKSSFEHLELYKLPSDGKATYLDIEVGNELDEIPVADSPETDAVPREGAARDVSPLILTAFKEREDDGGDLRFSSDEVLPFVQRLVRACSPANVATDSPENDDHNKVTAKLTAALQCLAADPPRAPDVLAIAAGLARIGQPTLAKEVLGLLKKSEVRVGDMIDLLADFGSIFFLDIKALWYSLKPLFEEIRDKAPTELEKKILEQCWLKFVELVADLTVFQSGFSPSSNSPGPLIRGLKRGKITKPADKGKGGDVLSLHTIQTGHRVNLAEGDVVSLSLTEHFTGIASGSVLCLAAVESVTPTPFAVGLRIMDQEWPTIIAFLEDGDTFVLHPVKPANFTLHKRVMEAAQKILRERSEEDFLPFLEVEEEEEKEQGPPDSLEECDNLNASQKRAVAAALRDRVTVIQGPPGTGKTQVACSVVLNALRRGTRRVLVVAETNIAVDNLTRRLAAKLPPEEVCRVGKTEKVDADLARATLAGKLELIAQTEARRVTVRDARGRAMHKKNVKKKVLGDAKVFLTTCAGAGDKDLRELDFPLVSTCLFILSVW